MSEAKVINSWEVKPYLCGNTYESRMILDNIVAGELTVQINEGTVKGGCTVGGGSHHDSEIYYAVKGEAILRLDDKTYDIKQGSLVFIPGGVVHSVENKSRTEDFVLLTIWMDANQNDMYVLRMKEWGKSFKTIYED
jgi:Mannose-6-phosphate isomerase